MTLEYIPIRDFSKRLAEGWKLASELKPGDWAAVMESPYDKVPVNVPAHLCKLTPNDVRAIRASTEPSRKIADEYQVDQKTVLMIRRGESYKWVEPA